MSGLFSGQRFLATLGIATFAVAAVIDSISADTILPLFTLAAGVAVGTVYVLRAPAGADRRGHMDAADDIIKWLRASLEGEEKAHEKTLEKLRRARAMIADQGMDLKEIDGSDPDIPKLPGTPDKGKANDQNIAR